MPVVNIHEAKTHFSRLVDRAAAGEEVVIAKAGRPVARLVAYSRPGPPRTPGGWEGKVRFGEDFDSLPDEIAAAFKGDSP
jgi:prevent-host-death family protein